MQYKEAGQNTNKVKSELVSNKEVKHTEIKLFKEKTLLMISIEHFQLRKEVFSIFNCIKLINCVNMTSEVLLHKTATLS